MPSTDDPNNAAKLSQKQKVNIVWFKRDLRLSDHTPLMLAEEAGLPTLLLYVFEPLKINDAHYSERHWRFVTQSLIDMNRSLKSQGVPAKVSVANEDIISVFEKISQQYHIECVFSHQETGLANTFARDKAVLRWTLDNAIKWQEAQSGAVIRPSENRDTWDKQWKNVMRAELVENTLSKIQFITVKFDTEQLPESWKQENASMQVGGASTAKKVLDDFFDERGKDYHWLISKPQQSQLSCSRMSPYLAWGNISLREMYQHLLSHWNRKGWRRPLIALSSRLHWHCHFIQKFESECSMQFEHINSGYQDMPFRDELEAQTDLQSWKHGQTGYPLVDACMRCLKATGYINFRMRAMLVSFLSHHLRIDWRSGVEHLASVFLDFEPGIHYAQFQMQAGVTGINTVRIYNPTKQAKEHDPDGVFIRRWCPELAELPNELLFEPWNLTAMEELMYGITLGEHYPKRIVDTAKSYRQASDRLWSWRKRPDVKQEAQRILQRHVRNPNGSR